VTGTRCRSGLPARRRIHFTATPPQRQRGVALLVAILLVALGTIIAATMAYNNAMTARRAAATFDFDQSLLVVQGAEALAAYGLKQQAQQNSPYTYPGQAWSQPLPPTEVLPGVMLEAHLEDLQGRFNINDLVQQNGNLPNQPAIAAFQRLLTMLGMEPKWADYIVDWIDKNSEPMTPDGGEDSVYMEMNPPYRTPNLPITSTSELMALPGFTRADYDRLAPYIVALPLSPATQINVCSASPYLLDALIGHIQFSADPEQFAKDREAAGTCFPTQKDVLTAAGNVAGNPQQQGLSSLITQKSAWFRLTSFITLGSTQFAVYTVLYQDPLGVRPIMRSFTPD
jgi:general secretion pathway protein K